VPRCPGSGGVSVEFGEVKWGQVGTDKLDSKYVKLRNVQSFKQSRIKEK
jgi:hypothetical protein